MTHCSPPMCRFLPAHHLPQETRLAEGLYLPWLISFNPTLPETLLENFAFSPFYTLNAHSLPSVCLSLGFPEGPNDKRPSCQFRRLKRRRFHPGSGRAPGGGNGNPLQHSCLENPTDRGARRAMVQKTLGRGRVRRDFRI